jgi:hypothetical protein
LPALACSGAAGLVISNANKDRAVTQVVKLLQGMLDKSKADGDSERDKYAKYKCYCDTNEAEKKEEIEKLTTEIQLLEDGIEELLSSNSKLSKLVADYKKDIEETEQMRATAESIRVKERAEFAALKLDLKAAMGQMIDAIKELAEVGADQTLSSGSDHAQYMAGHESLSQLKGTVKKALIAASAFVSPKQTAPVEAFLQAPFTGTYSAQSGEVVGILKDMHDTFKANLAQATATEDKAEKAWVKLDAQLRKKIMTLTALKEKADDQLSANDADLATKRAQLEAAQTSLEDAEAFLANLLDMCAAKKKQYEDRVQWRTSEDAAISKAIAILNSDEAFESFGKVDATKTGPTSLIQLRAVHRHKFAGAAAKTDAIRRQQAQAFLQRAVGAKSSPLLNRVVAMLQADNPFAVVLAEIEKMIKLIAAEEKADDEQKSWCDSERTEKDASIVKMEGEITVLLGDIDELTNEINDPTTGLKAQITDTEDALDVNDNSQKTETAERKDANLAYQQDIANLVGAEELLERAVVVLKNYYDKILKSSFVQREEPTPPETWDDKYAGQSAEGNSAVTMLEFILKNTKSEETAAHDAEREAQHGYEDSMASLKSEQLDLEKSLAVLRETLAKREKSLMQKEKELAATEKEKAALETYLEKIKPGCDFITANIALRKANRIEETKALTGAVDLLKGSPKYKEAMAASHDESLGKCLDICRPDGVDREAHVKCKACLADTSIPGYCAGHPGTEGC